MGETENTRKETTITCIKNSGRKKKERKCLQKKTSGRSTENGSWTCPLKFVGRIKIPWKGHGSKQNSDGSFTQ